MTAREAERQQFLDSLGWSEARQEPLAGDASDRSYRRLWRGAQSAILMDAPPGRGDDPADFVRIAEFLATAGLSPPRIMGRDLTHGFLLLEDLGDDLFATLMARDPGLQESLYRAAAEVLIQLHHTPAPAGLPDLSAADWAEAAMMCVDHYALSLTGSTDGREPLKSALQDAMATFADGPRVVILRDFHAENMLWLPSRAGVQKVGLLDFQLAQMGQPGYDLVSMLQDARRDVPLATEAAVIRHFLDLTGRDGASFSASYATLGAQRALRIIGIFARLCLVGGKPRYLELLPRVWDQLMRNLEHPALGVLRHAVMATLPAPSPDRIERIKAQCPMT